MISKTKEITEFKVSRQVSIAVEKVKRNSELRNFNEDVRILRNIMSRFPGGILRITSDDRKNVIITGKGEGNPELGYIEYLLLS